MFILAVHCKAGTLHEIRMLVQSTHLIVKPALADSLLYVRGLWVAGLPSVPNKSKYALRDLWLSVLFSSLQ